MAAGAEFWCDVRDSNPLPADYESAAPPLKLPSHRRSGKGSGAQGTLKSFLPIDE